MEVAAFLRLRTEFIGNFYDNAVRGFLATQRLIESGEPPFENPPFDDSGEPPFLREWSNAATSIEVVGRTAISMLSESLKVYFNEWDKLLGIQCAKHLKVEFKQGYWHGYRACFANACSIDWTQCPADADFIEQIALARNTSQHGGRITSMAAKHPENLRARFPNPIFVSEYEKNADEDEIPL